MFVFPRVVYVYMEEGSYIFLVPTKEIMHQFTTNLFNNYLSEPTYGTNQQRKIAKGPIITVSRRCD